MKNFLLALSTTQQSPEAISYAIDLAKQKKAKLITLFILDSNVPGTIFEKLTDIGFIGDKPSEELKEAVEKEYHQQAKEKLKEIEEQARSKNVDCETYINHGDFSEKSLEAIIKFSADMIILTRMRQSALSRIFFGSGIEKILRQAPCDIKIFEE